MTINDRIEALRDEAAAAGDLEQVALCDRADTAPEAREACIEALREGAAHDDAAFAELLQAIADAA